MSAEEFKQRVGQLLGVSTSERDMALDILLNKAADILEFFDAVKVRGLGIFQFKKDSAGVVDQNSILFVPAGVFKSPDKKFMYLTLKVNRQLSEDSFDENLFSPGIGKKILAPDESLEKAGGPEALRKHIEDKVDEILADSEQLEDFDIWQNYNLTGDESEVAEFGFGEQQEEKINFDEIAEEFSFDDIKPEIPADESPEVEPDDFLFDEEEIEFEDLAEDIAEEIPETEEKSPELEMETEDSESEDDSGEYLKSSIDIDFDFEKIAPLKSEPEDLPEEANDSEDGEEDTSEPPVFKKVSLEDFSIDEDDEASEEESDDWFSFDNPDEEEEKLEIQDEPDAENEKPLPDEEAWDWGEELEEQEIIEPEEDSIDEISNLNLPESEDEEEHDDEESLFQTLEKEITEIQDEPVHDNEFPDEMPDDDEDADESKFKLPPIIEVKEEDEENGVVNEESSFLPPNTSAEGKEEEEVDGEGNFDKKTWEEIYKDFDFEDIKKGTKKGSKKDEVKKLKEKTIGNKNFMRNILIIIAAMLVLASVVFYFFIMDETNEEGYQPGASDVTETVQPQNEENNNSQPADEESINNKLDEILSDQEKEEEPVNNPPAETLPEGNNSNVTPVEEKKTVEVPSSLYMDFSGGEQVKSLIFSLNGAYYVQIGSVPSASNAEREAKRLRAQGLNVYVSKVYISSKNDTYYRIKRGPFATLREAENYLANNR